MPVAPALDPADNGVQVAGVVRLIGMAGVVREDDLECALLKRAAQGDGCVVGDAE